MPSMPRVKGGNVSQSVLLDAGVFIGNWQPVTASPQDGCTMPATQQRRWLQGCAKSTPTTLVTGRCLMQMV